MDTTKNQLVVAQGKSDIVDGKAEFKITSTLWGKNEADLIQLRLNEAAQKFYRKGNQYLIAYSSLMKHPIVRDEIVADPKGARIVDYFYLQSALFNYNKELKELFSELTDSKSLTEKKRISLLVKQLGEDNLFNQQLAVFEFFQNASYLANMSEADKEAFKKMIATAKQDNEILTLALKFYRQSDDDKDIQWLADFSRKLIKSHGSQLKLTSYIPGLIKEAAGLLGQANNASDVELLSSLLDSNSPSVARTAFYSMHKINQGEAKQLAKVALKKQTLLQDTRRLLQGALK